MNIVFPFKNVSETRVSCEYGRKGSWASGKHDGIDLVSDGDRTVLSCTDGKCIRSGWNDSWGEYVVIQLNDNRSIVYAHMSKNSRKVEVGDKVKAGQEIGVMGSTGKSTGAHLHLELQKKYYVSGKVDNIATFLNIENKTGKVVSVKERYTIDILLDNDIVVNVDAINVDNVNYIKLRELEKIVNVVVAYNNDRRLITIKTKEL